MISEENIKEIKRIKFRKRKDSIIPWLVCVISFIINYSLEVTYSDKVNLFNDKLIDVSALFFGVFVGSLYLFDKFSDRPFYNSLIKFSKKLIALNIIVIVMSFIFVLYNESFLKIISFTILKKEFSLNLSLVLFSLYVSISTITMYYICKYIQILFLLIKHKNKNELENYH
ncbi:hypothetical protein [Myroides phaeus]|uniref:hypothetical protein n=1 Tax=Myroides phaeus TaxID=702745 RepID=UPI001303C7AD|nr:hypothetical protein [Myroides phaeus]